MRSLRMLTAALSATVVVAWAGAALADMTGTYTGGEDNGTTLDLRQTGPALNGIFTGGVEGVLLGTADGDDATGVLLIFDEAKVPFSAVFTGTELQLTFTELNGDVGVVTFALDSAAPAPRPPTKPVPQPVEAVPDHAAATEALRTLLVGLVGVEFGDRQGAVVECLIRATSPLSAAELRTLVAVGFDPDDALIAQFERTAPGIEAAVEACFGAGEVVQDTATLDDAAVDANLRTVILGVVAEELPPNATVAQRDAVVECLMLAVAGLPTADRQHLADIGFNPDRQEIARLETLVPGISDAVGACIG